VDRPSLSRLVAFFLATALVLGSGPSTTAAPASAAPRGAIDVAEAPAALASTAGAAQAPAARSGTVDATATAALATPTVAQLVGQKLVVRMDGAAPSPALLARIARGEVGGIIIFRSQVGTASALRSAIAQLQKAARDGRRPPLLVMTDQEGGVIRAIPWAAPGPSAASMGAHSTAYIRNEGAAAGTALRGLGINVDLAPVADVPSSTSSFMYQAARTFSRSAIAIAWDTVSFAAGLRGAGVIATAKHFPGIGRVRLNTDRYAQTVTATASALATDLGPFRSLIAAHVPMIMLSNATYTAWDRANGAGWSAAITTGLLRRTLGFTGVSITDGLDGTAASRHLREVDLAVRAALAGTDMLLLTGTESTTAATYRTLVANAQSGVLPTATLKASYARILALKATLPR
jgi:beta-N-acetylhexosaminidase